MKEDGIYVLMEVKESDDFLRDFDIIAYAEVKDGNLTQYNLLKDEMQSLIKEDKYGMISENGILTDSEEYFETIYDCGFMYYSIYKIKSILD